MALINGASALSVHSSLTAEKGGQPCSTLLWLTAAEQETCLQDLQASYTKDYEKAVTADKNAFIKKAFGKLPKDLSKKERKAANKKYDPKQKALKQYFKNRHRLEVQWMVKETKQPQPKTSAVKVTQECDGAVQRLKNDDAANLFENMKRSSVPYNDVSFPADKSSIWWDAYIRTPSFPEKNKDLTWKRAFDIDNGSLWGSKGILPAGVVQGQLGDCWWLAVASALAEHPERIKKIFANVDQNKGIYELEFFGQGINKVVIDDRLPLHPNGDPTFARQSQNDAWWLPLLEKGAAKFYGAYDNLHAGRAPEAFAMLTGYPSQRYGHNGEWTGSKLLKVIEMADDAHHVMYGSPLKSQDGITGRHGYSLLSHTTWDNKDFIQLRNPWAVGEFSGKWSDKDTTTGATQLKAFRAHVKQLNKHTVSEDGKFWMEFTDYEKYYSETTVGYYLDDYKQTRFQVNLRRDTKTQTIVLDNPVKQHVFLRAEATLQRQYLDGQCYAESRINSGEKFFIGMNKESMTLSNYAHLQWEKLPVGSYEIESRSSQAGKGSLSFSLVAFASKQPVKMGV